MYKWKRFAALLLVAIMCFNISFSLSATELEQSVNTPVTGDLPTNSENNSSANSENSSSQNESGTQEDSQQPFEEDLIPPQQDQGEDEYIAENLPQQEDVAEDTQEVLPIQNSLSLGYAFTTVAELARALGGYGSLQEQDGVIASFTITHQSALFLLSNTDPYLYKTATINVSASGSGFALTGTVTVGESIYSFLGLGDSNYPFAGTLSTSVTWFNAIDRPLFNSVSSKACVESNANITLDHVGHGTIAFAEEFVFEEDAPTPQWNLTINATGTDFPTLGSVMGVVKGANGTLNLTLNYGAGSEIEAVYSENAGMICNTLQSGSIELTLSSLPSAISITALQGDAGALIGRMEQGTGLNFGSMQLENIKVSALQGNAGGVIGSARDIKFSCNSLIISAASNTVSGKTAGGLVGLHVYSGVENSWNSVQQNQFSVQNITINASENMGGLFGALYLQNAQDSTGATTFSILGKSENSFGISTTQIGSTAISGGLIGTVSGGANTAYYNKLLIENSEASTSFSTGVAQFGGVIGSVTNNVYVQIKNAQTNLTGVSANTSLGLGGLVASSENAVLDLENITVMANSSGAIAGNSSKYAGGVVGYAGKGTAIRFSGTTNLSNTKYTAAAQTGQLVGAQENAIVYAESAWANQYTRTTDTAVTNVDDIGNYGQVIRLSGIMSLSDTTNKVTVQPATNGYSSNVTLASKEDFAKLAITIQTNGTFSAYSAITADTGVSAILSSTIEITNDIDLTGTGILGLMRSGTTTGNFSGAIQGNGHTITLASGEKYGIRSDANGDGRIYQHTRIGLLANISGNNAKIENLTVNGNIFYGNSASTKYVGGISAIGNTVTVSNVTSAVNLDGRVIDNDTNYYVGSFFGSISGNGTVMLSTVVGNANMVHQGVSTTVRQGGIIGLMAGSSTIQAQEVTLKGAIYNETSKSIANVGGFIAETESNSTQTINIQSITVDGQIIQTIASGASGGLLGYQWNTANVYFASNTDPSQTGLVVKGSSKITLTGAGSLGGLVNISTGYWQVNQIDLQKLSISKGTGALGLLVNSGRVNSEQAVYLELASSTAYKIANNVSITSTGGIFDELVANTATGSTIMGNNNGVISIATQNTGDTRDLVNFSGSSNTYVNRTTNNGVAWANNPNSRYYYNLDVYRNNNSNVSNGVLDTAQKVLLWSVRTYGANNIKDMFLPPLTESTFGYTITNADNEIDLTGYSYYPVNLSTADMSIDNVHIVFNNAGIESTEQSAKDARVTSQVSPRTQHYAMHCGLINNFSASTTEETVRYTFSVKNLTLSGSVGAYNGGSGALVAGTIHGVYASSSVRQHEVEISDINLRNLYVVGADDKQYAPLLINKIGSYSTLNVTGLVVESAQGVYNYAQYEKANQNYAATSLIGEVGSSTAYAISLSFSKIIVEAQESSSVFSRATLLEQFMYPANAACSGFYDFNHENDWLNGNHIKQVTYGKEISSSVENAGLQYWYYDTQGQYYVSANSATQSTPHTDFENGYLPYVYKTEVQNATDYAISGNYHELKVNIAIADLLNGCGSYGHPYEITTAAELETIANFLQSNNTQPNNGWQVRVCTNATLHSENEDTHCAVYTYDGSLWNSSNDTITTAQIREYLRNAYYEIARDIVLSDKFVGIGGATYAFRGVITGGLMKNSVTISANSQAYGLINYSYGCVVKDLTVAYTGQRTIEVNVKTNNTSTSNFFGGVIAHIRGGDNIVDNVTVNIPDTFMQVQGVYGYLAPVGGYVGLIEGGGVIFRNMDESSDPSRLKTVRINDTITIIDETTNNYFYINPYVGRVLDGFAIYEKENTNSNVLNNTNKNYQIPTIDSTKTGVNAELKTEFYDGYGSNRTYGGGATLYAKTTVASVQGHLLLCAILNSGAAAGGFNRADYYGTYAYYGQVSDGTAYGFGNTNFGKVRNATYKFVGLADGYDPIKAQEDFELSQNDDTKAPGGTHSAQTMQVPSTGTRFTTPIYGTALNAPYLITKYTDESKFTYFYSASYTRVSMEYSDATVYDLAQYQNGYRALGGRYQSTAVQTGGSSYNADRSTPYIYIIEGNNATISFDITAKEYSGDNFPTISVGGMFNAFQQDERLPVNTGTTHGSPTVRNFTIGGENEQNTAEVSLTYYVGATSTTTVETTAQNQTSVGVGGFAGRSANRGSGNNERPVAFQSRYENVHLQNLVVAGSRNAGGLFGVVGVNTYTNSLRHSSSNVNYFSVSMNGCTYNNINVSAGYFVGGFMGVCSPNATSTGTANGSNELQESSYVNCSGYNSTLRVARGASHDFATGGIVGLATHTQRVSQSFVKKVTFQGSTSQGGLVGKLAGNTSQSTTVRKLAVNQVNIEEISTATTARAAGGLIGYADQSQVEVDNTVIQDSIISGSSGYGTGGVLGRFAAQNPTRSTLVGSNILCFNNRIVNSNSTQTNTGVFVGITVAGNIIKLAGVSVKTMGEKGEELKALLPTYNVGNNGSYTGYIAYADYTHGAGAVVDGSEQGYAPYVTTSPKTSTQLKNADDAMFYVHGDGAASTQISPIVQMISEDAQEGAVAQHTNPTYKNMGTSAKALAAKLSNSTERENYLSTYQQNQTGGNYSAEDAQKPQDFSVLLVDYSSVAEIASYIDIVTNGGYSSAVAQADVTASVAQYKWNGTQFVQVESGTRPAMVVTNNGTANLGFRLTSEYDNDRDRFTLLSVTLSSGTSGTYMVHVPIIVKRILEIDFMATMVYGTVFQKDEYASLNTHVLDSFGNPVTTYLTYTYNSARGTGVSYGWQSYIDGGGNANLSYEKWIRFVNTSGVILAGTEFTLIDCQNNNISYTYRLENDLPTTASALNLSLFKDSSGNAFQGKTLSVLMGATATAGTDWIEVSPENSATATVQTVDGKYYRQIANDETGTHTITIQDNAVSENYYLVMCIPQTENSVAINGQIKTAMAGDGLPVKNITQVHRYNPSILDENTLNTESTYCFLSGYTMSITDKSLDKSSGEDSSKIDYVAFKPNDKNIMNINLFNEITFDAQQVYQENDNLYLRYQINLTNILSSESRRVSFPSGVSGTANFYVYRMDANGKKIYYTSNNNGELFVSAEKAIAGSYQYVSDGGNMVLDILTENELNYVSLSKVRQDAKDASSSKFFVELEMAVEFSDSQTNAAIPSYLTSVESEIPLEYAQLQYTAMLATEPKLIDYSSTKVSVSGDVGYYLDQESITSLKYKALIPSQLGINVSDTIEAERIINTAATYNLANLKTLQTTLEDATRLEYTVELEQRTAVANGAYEKVLPANSYVKIDWGNDSSPVYADENGNFTWQITKNSGVGTSAQFPYYNSDDSLFYMPIKVTVATNIQEKAQVYANYRIKVTVRLYSENKLLDEQRQDYITYTIAKINFNGLEAE